MGGPGHGLPVERGSSRGGGEQQGEKDLTSKAMYFSRDRPECFAAIIAIT